MLTSIVLTVSESKRLIARGIAKHPAVQRALKDGTVAIAKGSTNSYIVEEILGKSIEKNNYCTGTTFPTRADRAGKVSSSIPDVVLKNGEQVEGAGVNEYITEMRAGDVFMKGANALNYERKQAGILIGHPTSGTIGATYGPVISRRINYIIPVGLEKSIPGDIVEAHRLLADPGERMGAVPALYPVFGEIFTEIEALKTLGGVEAKPTGAGGIGGAEGAVWLAISGTKEQLDRTVELLEAIYGEPAFIERH